MATTEPEVLAKRRLIARRIDAHFQQIRSLLEEAELPSNALVVMSDGSPVVLIEWAQLDTKLILEEPMALE